MLFSGLGQPHPGPWWSLSVSTEVCFHDTIGVCGVCGWRGWRPNTMSYEGTRLPQHGTCSLVGFSYRVHISNILCKYDFWGKKEVIFLNLRSTFWIVNQISERNPRSLHFQRSQIHRDRGLWRQNSHVRDFRKKGSFFRRKFVNIRKGGSYLSTLLS